MKQLMLTFIKVMLKSGPDFNQILINLFLKLRYNCYITLCKFIVYEALIWYIYL